jgi:hypothetical protein
VAFVFALAGFAKIDDPTSAIVFLKLGFDVPFDAAARLVLMIACVEMVLAGWLAFDLGRSLRPAVAGLALVGCFSGLLLAVAHANPRSTWTCGCFGALQPPWGGKTLMSHLKFDLVLAAAFLCQTATWRIANRGEKPNRRGGNSAAGCRVTAELK